MSTITVNLGDDLDDVDDLTAQLREGLTNVGSPITGFTNLGVGAYRLTLTIPDGVDNARIYSPSDTSYCVVGIEPSSTSGSTPPPSDDTDTVTAYLYTHDASGMITPGLVLSYQLLGADAGAGSGTDNDVHTVTSDSDALATVEMVRGGYYKYWLGNGRYRLVHITAETADPYELPSVTG